MFDERLPARPRKFLYVWKRLTPDDPLSFQIFHDWPPTSSQMKALGPLVYAVELTGKWYEMSLDEIVAEYRRRECEQRAPTGNHLAKAAKAAEPGAERKVGYRERVFRTGDLPPAEETEPWRPKSERMASP